MSGATDGWGTKVVNVSDFQQQLAAKDAEIERLRGRLGLMMQVVDANERDDEMLTAKEVDRLCAIAHGVCDREVLPEHSERIAVNYGPAEEAPQRAPHTAQSRRSDVSRSSSPDIPTGDPE